MAQPPEGDESRDRGMDSAYEPLVSPAAGEPTSHPPRVRFACILLNFLIEMFDQIVIVPQIALFERSICYHYYSVHDFHVIATGGSIDDRLCKIEPVQQQLADLRSLKAFFDAVPVFFVAIPFGILADRYGRKKVLASSIFGSVTGVLWMLFVCRLDSGIPIQFIWFSALFYLFGNLASANATVYAMAADSCPPSKRSQYFYYLYSTYLVCELLAPAIASVTITKNLFLPFGIGIAIIMMCFPVLILMPETHQLGNESALRPSSALDNEVTGTTILGIPSRPESQDRPKQSNTSLREIFRQRRMLLAFLILYISAWRPATVSVLLQYATVRFGWQISQTAILISEIAIVNIILFLIILPQIIAWISSRWHIQPQLIDWTIVVISLLLLALGSLLMGLAPSSKVLIPSVIVFASGFGTRVSTLSLATLWTSEDIRARVFSIIQIVENIGKLSAEPILLKLLSLSLNMEKFWLGLPFFTVTGFYCLGAFCWRFVTLTM